MWQKHLVFQKPLSQEPFQEGRIGQETRDRVLKYIEEHDYKPNVIAKGLAQSKTYNLCVVMPGEYDVVDLTFFQECLFGIQEIAGIMEYDILLSICKNTISPRWSVLSQTVSRWCDPDEDVCGGPAD